MLKLVEVTSGYETNWHSILEQTTGLFNGLALAVAMAAPLAAIGAGRAEPTGGPCPPDRRHSPWASWCSGITYLNLRKNVGQWVAVQASAGGDGRPLRRGLVRPGLPADRVDVPGALVRHRRRPLAIVPPSPLGRGQLLYIVLLWWLVVGNFERALVAFTAAAAGDRRRDLRGRLGVHADRARWRRPRESAMTEPPATRDVPRPWLAGRSRPACSRRRCSIVVDWAVVRAIYGDRFAGHACLHIRFGPRRDDPSAREAPMSSRDRVRSIGRS